MQRKSLESKRGKPYRSIINNNPCIALPQRPFQNEKFFRTFEKSTKRTTSKKKVFNVNSEVQVAFQSNPLTNTSKDKRCSDNDSSFCQLSQTDAHESSRLVQKPDEIYLGFYKQEKLKTLHAKTISNKAPPPTKNSNVNPQPRATNKSNMIYLEFDLSPSRMVKIPDPNSCILPAYQGVYRISKSKSKERKSCEVAAQSGSSKSRPRKNGEPKAYQPICLGPLVSDLHSSSMSSKRRRSSNATDPPVTRSTNCETN